MSHKSSDIKVTDTNIMFTNYRWVIIIQNTHLLSLDFYFLFLQCSSVPTGTLFFQNVPNRNPYVVGVPLSSEVCYSSCIYHHRVLSNAVICGSTWIPAWVNDYIHIKHVSSIINMLLMGFFFSIWFSVGIHSPISFVSLSSDQSYNCPIASKLTPKHMVKTRLLKNTNFNNAGVVCTIPTQ